MQQLKAFLNGKKQIIWDWNGTLLNDVETSVAAMAQVLKSRGMPPLDTDTYRSVFGFPIKTYYARIGLDTGEEEMTRLSHEFHKNYDDEFAACRLHNGVEEMLDELKSLEIKHSILSAAQQDWLLKQLHHFGIRNYFEHVYGLTNFLGQSKVDRGHELIQASDLSPKELLLVGDTDHDVEVAQALGIDVVIYADGHQSPERFRHLNVPVLTRSIVK